MPDARVQTTPPGAPPAAGCTPTFFLLGYAGPRRLGDGDRPSATWEPQLRTALATAAAGLRERLGARRPLCLVGALAVGADLVIAETLLAQGAVLRAWLPEPLDRFTEERDFPEPADRARAHALAAHPQTAEVRVVSTAAGRRERFAACAARIVRDSDALLVVRHWDPADQRGGTEETLADARALGRPVVEIRLASDPATVAQVEFSGVWPAPTAAGGNDATAALPLFPRPEPRTAVAAQQAAASAEAARSKRFLVRAAAWTVGLQLSVTVMAVSTLGRPAWDVPALLAKTGVILVSVMLALLAARRGLAARWADRRLRAELHRSWRAVRGLPAAAPWLEAELPASLAATGRDLAILHGLDGAGGASPENGDTAAAAGPTPEPASAAGAAGRFRNRYLAERVGPQLAYATTAARGAARWRTRLTRTLHACLGITLAALLTKLGLRAAEAVEAWATLDRVSSLVSFLGPTFGAGAVSFVALLDLPARATTQAQLAEFLAAQRDALTQAADDWTTLIPLVAATEHRLIAETRAWHARHAFRG